MLSVTGELHFNAFGFGCQMFGSFTECLRVVLIGILLSKQGLKLDPLTALSYYAPIAFAVLLPLALLTELPADLAMMRAEFEANMGWPWLIANGVLAFMLNVAVVSLISRTDPVVYVVVGVLKDILVVFVSAFVLTVPVTGQQLLGYIGAIVGVQVFNMVQKSPADFEDGVFIGLWLLLRQHLPGQRDKGYLPVSTVPQVQPDIVGAPDQEGGQPRTRPEPGPPRTALSDGATSD